MMASIFAILVLFSVTKAMSNQASALVVLRSSETSSPSSTSTQNQNGFVINFNQRLYIEKNIYTSQLPAIIKNEIEIIYKDSKKQLNIDCDNDCD